MTHYYKRGDFKYPSVTTIISDCTDKSGALSQWAANQASEMLGGLAVSDIYPWVSVHKDDLNNARFAYKETSQTALDVGSEVHNAIEKYLQIQPVNDKLVMEMSCEQAQKAFEAFIGWKKEHDLKPTALEQTVFGDSWAGTLDFLGMFDGKLYVIDWKSSKAHYPEMRYQVAAYRSAVDLSPHIPDHIKITHQKPPEVQGCGVLRLDKETGLPDWKDTTKSYEKDLKIFNAMLQLYMLRHPRISKGAGWKNI